MQKILTTIFLAASSAAVVADPASLLVYRVWEQGAEPYLSRVMVTPGHVRLDEGSDGAGYTLFDRNNERIYNVSVDDRSILVLDSAQPLPALPDTLVLQEQVEADTGAPLVAGQRPNHVRLLANGELCAELVTIESVMEEAVRGLTEAAATKVQELITAEGDDALALRVAVRPGGCSGFSYEMFFDSDIAGEDVTADFQGVKVVVDASSAQMLAGATLDYKDGLNQAGFSIDNPNAQRTCGCGSSFS